MKHGTVSSKIRGVQKAELGIAPPRSSLNLGCFRTVGGPFGTWSGALSGLGLGPFRDLVGALSGLGWGAFARFRWGVFRSTQGKKEKQQARNANQACVHSLFVWLVSRTQEGRMPRSGRSLIHESCNKQRQRAKGSTAL